MYKVNFSPVETCAPLSESLPRTKTYLAQLSNPFKRIHFLLDGGVTQIFGVFSRLRMYYNNHLMDGVSVKQ